MISESHLQRIKVLIASEMGWEFGQSRNSDLQRALMALAVENGVSKNSVAIHRWLDSMQWSIREFEFLARQLTVGETYFFREKPHLDFFRKTIIPEIIASRQHSNPTIRIWSAGCCTGEEPYSLAMLLWESVPDISQWKVTILATDVNQTYLDKAGKGLFSAWSFRETPEAIRQRYFTQKGNQWQIVPEIRTMVTFMRLNLATGIYPSDTNNTAGYDVIFCRNVLMYFALSQIKMVTSRFYQALNPDGFLIPGIVESNNDNFPAFFPINVGNCTIYACQEQVAQKKVQSIQDFPASSRRIDPAAKIPKKAKSEKLAETVIRDLPVSPIDRNYKPDPEILFGLGRYDECIRHCRELLVQEPDNMQILDLMTKSLANSGNLNEALAFATKLVENRQAGPDHFYFVATIFSEMGEEQKAIDLLKKALYLDPHHLLSHYLIGRILKKLNNRKSAARHLNNALELLSAFQSDQMISDADGLTAGRLKQMVMSSLK